MTATTAIQAKNFIFIKDRGKVRKGCFKTKEKKKNKKEKVKRIEYNCVFRKNTYIVNIVRINDGPLHGCNIKIATQKLLSAPKVGVSCFFV